MSQNKYKKISGIFYQANKKQFTWKQLADYYLPCLTGGGVGRLKQRTLLRELSIAQWMRPV